MLDVLDSTIPGPIEWHLAPCNAISSRMLDPELVIRSCFGVVVLHCSIVCLPSILICTIVPKAVTMTGRLRIEEVFDVVCVALAMIICRHGFRTGFIGRMGALIDKLFHVKSCMFSPRVRSPETYLGGIARPSLTSSEAALTIAGVNRFNLPSSSSSPQRPQAE